MKSTALQLWDPRDISRILTWPSLGILQEILPEILVRLLFSKVDCLARQLRARKAIRWLTF